MKKIYLLTLILLPLLLAACSEGESTEMKLNDKVTFSAQALCIIKGEKKADKGATLYIFEEFSDTKNFTFSNGKYIDNETGNAIDFTHKATTNSIGIATLTTRYGQTCTCVIQSAAFPAQYSASIHKLNGNQSQVGLGQVTFEERK